MSDVSGIDNLTSSSNGSSSLTGIKAAVDNLNSGKAESSAVVPNTRQVAGHALSADVTLVKGDVGLGNVDNTSDATKNAASAALTNKTISDATNTFTFTNIATGNVSATAHGLTPILPNDASEFLDGTGNYSRPNIVKARFQTAFETAARFTPGFNVGSVTFNTGGAVLTTAGSGAGNAEVSVALPTGFAVFAAGGVFNSIFTFTAIGTTADFFIGLGHPTDSPTAGITFTDAHIGFKVLVSGSTATLYATCADGTETAVSLGTIAANDVIEVIAQVVSTASVSFYFRKNGGALSAATNITTHIPTAANVTLDAAVSTHNASVIQTVAIAAMGYER